MYQYLTKELDRSCLKIKEGMLKQTPFDVYCMRSVDIYICIISGFLYFYVYVFIINWLFQFFCKLYDTRFIKRKQNEIWHGGMNEEEISGLEELNQEENTSLKNIWSTLKTLSKKPKKSANTSKSGTLETSGKVFSRQDQVILRKKSLKFKYLSRYEANLKLNICNGKCVRQER